MDDFEYDDFEQSMAPEAEYECEECGAAIFSEGLCKSCEDEDPCEDYDESELYNGGNVEFADFSGTSALRAASSSNPRNLPCPSCGRENMLTPADKSRGYQCDYCADELERGY